MQGSMQSSMASASLLALAQVRVDINVPLLGLLGILLTHECDEARPQVQSKPHAPVLRHIVIVIPHPRAVEHHARSGLCGLLYVALVLGGESGRVVVKVAECADEHAPHLEREKGKAHPWAWVEETQSFSPATAGGDAGSVTVPYVGSQRSRFAPWGPLETAVLATFAP